MGLRRCVCLLFVVGMAFCLCACGNKGEKTYCVSLSSAVGSGFYWNCGVADEDVVSVEKQEKEPDTVALGNSFQTEFTFSPRKQGTTTALFTCKQSWSDTICYYQSCELTVDAENKIKGELSEETAVLNLGDQEYEVSCTDSSVVTWYRDGTTGKYVIRPYNKGVATLTFTCEGENPGERTQQAFQVTVYEDMSLLLSGNSTPQGTTSYGTVKELEQEIGISMHFPEWLETAEIRSVGTLGYIAFQWAGMSCAYVGGDLDVSTFFQNANTTMIEGIPVGLPKGQWTVAGWEKDGMVYYISCDGVMPSKHLTELLYQLMIV